jgi:hypothetical protein
MEEKKDIEKETTPKPEIYDVEKPEEKQESSSNDLIADANRAAARLEAANRESLRLIRLAEKQKLEETFAGKANAGKKQTSKEDKATEAARKLIEGSGYEDELFPRK